MSKVGFINEKMRQEDGLWDDISVKWNEMYSVEATAAGIIEPIFELFMNDGIASIGVWKWLFIPVGPPFMSLFFTVEIPHDWKVGTPIFPHVHFSPDVFGGPPGDVGWQLEYTIAAPGAVFPPTVLLPLISSTIGLPLVHEYTIPPLSFPITVPPTPTDVSAIMQCRISRGEAPDTFASGVFLHSVDFHYLRDDLGSKDEWSKE